MRLPPRYAAMVVGAAEYGQARQAAEIALLVSERGLGSDSSDVEQRWEHFCSDRSERAKAVRRLAATMTAQFDRPERENTPQRSFSVGALVSLAWPDRISISRGDGFLLANGSGARIDKADALARQPFLAIAELHGKAASARIGAAAAITREEIETLHGSAISETNSIDFDAGALALRPRSNRRLGAIALSSSAWRPPREAIDEAMLAAIRRTGLARLSWDSATKRLRDRIAFLHRANPQRWRDVGDEALLADLENWLAPFLDGATAFARHRHRKDPRRSVPPVGEPRDRRRDRRTRGAGIFHTPAGTRHALRYDGEQVVLARPRAGVLRSRQSSGNRRRAHPADAGTAVASNATDPGNARFARLLDRLLAPGARGNARSLPQHEWPENPGGGETDDACQAARLKGAFASQPWRADNGVKPGKTGKDMVGRIAHERGLRLETLIRIRWLAVAGQTLAVAGRRLRARI